MVVEGIRPHAQNYHQECRIMNERRKSELTSKQIKAATGKDGTFTCLQVEALGLAWDKEGMWKYQAATMLFTADQIRRFIELRDLTPGPKVAPPPPPPKPHKKPGKYTRTWLCTLSKGEIHSHVLYFDGSCGPKNPGGTARFGWILTLPTGISLNHGFGVACSGPSVTNNVAEWHGLLKALKHIETRSDRLEMRLLILGDSRLVISQLTGTCRCNKQHLLTYRDACRKLLNGLRWRAEWIPREQNQRADELSKRQR